MDLVNSAQGGYEPAHDRSEYFGYDPPISVNEGAMVDQDPPYKITNYF